MNKKGFFLVILAGLLWGTSGIFVKLLSPYGVTSWVLTLFRGLAGLGFLSIFLLVKDRSLFRISRRELVLFFFLGGTMFGASAFYYAAIQQTSIATAVVLMYTSPVWVMVFSVLFMGERMTVIKGISVGAMLIGCGLVSGIAGGLDFNIVGILLALGAGVSYSAYTILAKVAMDRQYRPLTTTYYSFVFMVVFALPFADPASIPSQVGALPWWGVILLCTMGLVTAMSPYFLFSIAMKTLPAGTASALGIVEPMAGTVYGMIFFAEGLSLLAGVGIALILGSVAALGLIDDSKKENLKKINIKKEENCNEEVESFSRDH